jgi:hypothetical protein
MEVEKRDSKISMMKVLEQNHREEKERLHSEIENLKQKLISFDRLEQELREIEDRTR